MINQLTCSNLFLFESRKTLDFLSSLVILSYLIMEIKYNLLCLKIYLNYITSAVLRDVSSILLHNHDLSAFKSVVFTSIIIVIGKVNLKNRKWQRYCYQCIIIRLLNIRNRKQYTLNNCHFFHEIKYIIFIQY